MSSINVSPSGDANGAYAVGAWVGSMYLLFPSINCVTHSARSFGWTNVKASSIAGANGYRASLMQAGVSMKLQGSERLYQAFFPFAGFPSQPDYIRADSR